MLLKRATFVLGKNAFTHDPLNGDDVTSHSLLFDLLLAFLQSITLCVLENRVWFQPISTFYSIKKKVQKKEKNIRQSFYLSHDTSWDSGIRKWQHWCFVLGNCALILAHQLVYCLAVKNRNIDYCVYILRDEGGKACKVKREKKSYFKKK